MNSYNYAGEMKVPTRAAPPPPSSGNSWANFFVPKDQQINTKSCQPKKKPPPRPPPPKFNKPSDNRGSHLVSGLFRSQARPIYEPVTSMSNGGCLIDWTSPPSSPTSTTRSSSDALSVNSFGSDSITPSSGSTSNVESGFEDDFDLFGPPVNGPNDPWSPQPAQVTAVKSSWTTFSPQAPKKLNMPTIIRAKPERPKPPKILEKKLEMHALAEVFSSTHVSNVDNVNTMQDNFDDWASDSPPMPTCPPPAPPPEILAQLVSSQLEKTAYKSQQVGRTEQTARALFDYNGVAGDLNFRQGDCLRILRLIDENWLEAELNGNRGTVPANFIQIENEDPRLVTALFAFAPETWEDLALQPGLRVRLLGRVNAEWLYGESDGRRGQFPANFVDHVPSDLPQWVRR